MWIIGISINYWLYIFDDSFSALDYKTDSVLRKELRKYTKDATFCVGDKGVDANIAFFLISIGNEPS